MERNVIAKFKPPALILGGLSNPIALVSTVILPRIVTRDRQKSPSSPFAVARGCIAWPIGRLTQHLFKLITLSRRSAVNGKDVSRAGGLRGVVSKTHLADEVGPRRTVD